MRRCVVDTNVLVTANKAIRELTDDSEMIISKYPNLVANCINTLLDITVKGTYIVLDTNGEIFLEYSRYSNYSGQPGVGDEFFKWLHDHRNSFPESEKIELHKNEYGYEEFPAEMEELNVDPSDKKFFAVSNAHKAKPKILQATDSKWWGWTEAAQKSGIDIMFMDNQYMIDHQ